MPLSAAGSARRRGWRGAFLHTGRTLVALVSVAVLGTMGYGWWAVGDIDQGTVTTDVIDHEVESQPVPLDGAVDILLVGLDSRTDAHGNPLPDEVLRMLHAGVSDGELNTDTMILVHIPVDGTRAVAISFPRDSWVELAGGYGFHRLNSAFAYAYNDTRSTLVNSGVTDEDRLDSEATIEGRKNLIATVESLVGDSVTIDRYAEVNLASFYEVTKAIGGVEVCLNEAVNEPLSGAKFSKGRQTISGADALSFVRQRHELPNGDLDRIVRQQAFLAALANKVLSADMLTNPSRARDLVAAVQRSVVLSDGWDLTTFAAQMQGLTSDGIDFHTIPTLGGANIGGADVLEVDPHQVQQFVAALTTGDQTDEPAGGSDGAEAGSEATGDADSPVPGEDQDESDSASGSGDGSGGPSGSDRPVVDTTTVEVRNGSNTIGLAASVRDSLTDRGFVGGQIGDTGVQSHSVIEYPSGELSVAEYVAAELPGEFVLTERAELGTGTLRLLLGTDYPPPSDTTPAGQPDETAAGQPSSGDEDPADQSSTPPVQINADGVNCVN